MANKEEKLKTPVVGVSVTGGPKIPTKLPLK